MRGRERTTQSQESALTRPVLKQKVSIIRSETCRLWVGVDLGDLTAGTQMSRRDDAAAAQDERATCTPRAHHILCVLTSRARHILCVLTTGVSFLMVFTYTGRFPVCLDARHSDNTPAAHILHQIRRRMVPACGQKNSQCNHHKSDWTNDVLSQSRLPGVTLAVLYHLSMYSSTSPNL